MHAARTLCFALLVAAFAGPSWAPPFGRPYHPPSPPPYRPPIHEVPRGGSDASPTPDFILPDALKNRSHDQDLLDRLLRQYQSDVRDRAPAIAEPKPDTTPPSSVGEKQEGTHPANIPTAQLEETKWKSGVRQYAVSIASKGSVTNRVVDVPTWEFLKLERTLVHRRMAKAFGDTDSEAPVFFTKMPPGVSTPDVLPGRMAARTFDDSLRFVDDHVRNLDRLRSLRLDPANTRVFNLVGAPEGAPAGKARRWTKLRKSYDEAASFFFNDTATTEKSALLETLAAGTLDVLVIVAHGDRSAIYLPDGTSVSVQDVIALPPLPAGKRPLVVLLSCETGSSGGTSVVTLAQALMLRGHAAAVLAPTRPVPAGAATVKVLADVVSSLKEGSFDRLMRRLAAPWQVIVEALPHIRGGGQA